MRRRVSKRTNSTTALLQHILDHDSHILNVKVRLGLDNQLAHYQSHVEGHTLHFTLNQTALRHISAKGITELLRWMKKEVEHANNSWTETDPSDMERDIELYSQDLQNMEVMIDGEPDDV
jgi:hypothetical protein